MGNGRFTIQGVAVVLFQSPQQLHVDVRAPGDTTTVFNPPRDLSQPERAIRWFFSVPRWVQLTGAVLARLAIVVALALVWRHRSSLAAAGRTRELRRGGPLTTAERHPHP
jgi:hypothetical protein